MEHKLGIHDTCGVLNLHGMPGIIGAIVSMIGAAVATGDLYQKWDANHSARTHVHRIRHSFS